MCNHLFVDGFGGMGDALVCRYCGLDKYPESIPLLVSFAKAQGRIIGKDHPDYDLHASAAIEARNRNRSLNDAKV